MIAAFDVQYDENRASSAMVLFHTWTDVEAFETLHHFVNDCREYEPGQFYKREMPVILDTLAQTDKEVETIVVDCHVDLEQGHPALGRHLYNSLDKAVAVIGVAKSRFRNSDLAVEIRRGRSNKPLFVTAAGIESTVAANSILEMSGDFRIPTLLKLADSIARQNG